MYEVCVWNHCWDFFSCCGLKNVGNITVTEFTFGECKKRVISMGDKRVKWDTHLRVINEAWKRKCEKYYTWFIDRRNVPESCISSFSESAACLDDSISRQIPPPQPPCGLHLPETRISYWHYIQFNSGNHWRGQQRARKAIPERGRSRAEDILRSVRYEQLTSWLRLKFQYFIYSGEIRL